MHVSDAFAAQTRFKERVVHGMLLASYFSQLVGMHLGTPKVLYLSQSLNFKNPVFIDDEIEVIGELKNYSESTKIATYSTSIKKKEVVCVEGEAKILLL